MIAHIDWKPLTSSCHPTNAGLYLIAAEERLTKSVNGEPFTEVAWWSTNGLGFGEIVQTYYHVSYWSLMPLHPRDWGQRPSRTSAI
jgi:hypothetical protein